VPEARVEARHPVESDGFRFVELFQDPASMAFSDGVLTPAEAGVRFVPLKASPGRSRRRWRPKSSRMSRSKGVSWATRGQIIAMVGLEGLLVTVTGVLGGTIASLFTVLPFQNARATGWLPSATLFPYAVIIAIAAALTAASTIGTTRRII
jgi:hypothetical protein